MTVYTVVFTPEAQEQLVALYRYIASAASPEVAERYTGAIVTQCEELRTFPHRGASRDDIRPGLRVTNHRGRAIIAFDVSDELISIIGVYYGGQDYATMLRSEDL